MTTKTIIQDGVILAEQMFGYNQSTYKGVLRTNKRIAIWYFYNVKTGKPVTEDNLYEELIDKVSDILGERSMEPIIIPMSEDEAAEIREAMRKQGDFDLPGSEEFGGRR